MLSSISAVVLRPIRKLRALRRRPMLALTGMGTIAAVLASAPHQWCEQEADGYFEGRSQIALARGVREWVAGGHDIRAYATGSPRFDGEWLFMTYQMAGMGLAQTALEHPELRPDHIAAIDICIERMTTDALKAFDRSAWGEDPIATLEGGRGHVAYLGYLNVLLSYRRLLDPQAPRAELSDRVTEALARRLAGSPTLLVETYPNEVYPVDNAAAVGSIALYDRAMGTDHGELLRRWAERCRRDYIDRATGLLVQVVDPKTGAAADAPRASGTCLAIHFLSFMDDPLSSEMYKSVVANASGSVLGFGTVLEYPRGVPAGSGDIDSGPVIMGHGVSATGFGLAGARIYGDRDRYRKLYATAHLFGAPLEQDGVRHFVSGGPLGDAIMLAMLSAQDRAKLPARPATRPAQSTEGRR